MLRLVQPLRSSGHPCLSKQHSQSTHRDSTSVFPLSHNCFDAENIFVTVKQTETLPNVNSNIKKIKGPHAGSLQTDTES